LVGGALCSAIICSHAIAPSRGFGVSSALGPFASCQLQREGIGSAVMAQTFLMPVVGEEGLVQFLGGRLVHRRRVGVPSAHKREMSLREM
jgi:hypothetical protein